MSEPVRICLVGATGLIGSEVIKAAVGREDVRVIAIARREVALPPGARMELLLGDSGQWPALIAAARADVLVCALGTTIRDAGSEQAFLAVDRDLVLACAEAARACGIARMVAVSSVGADPEARAFYLRTKGEVEAKLAQFGFTRLDLLRPALLLGRRARRRPLEQAAQWIQPLFDPLIFGGLRRYRSIRASTVAKAILALAAETGRGARTYQYREIRALARGAGD